MRGQDVGAVLAELSPEGEGAQRGPSQVARMRRNQADSTGGWAGMWGGDGHLQAKERPRRNNPANTSVSGSSLQD